MPRPRELIHTLCCRLDYPLRVEFWDGTAERYGTAPPRFTLRFRDEATCRRLFDDLALRFGEAYVAGTIEIDGRLTDVVDMLLSTELSRLRLPMLAKLRIAYMALQQRNTRRRAPANIAHHYDLGNDFFSLWLGRDMAYSCAYFESPHDDLDTAQTAKFEHICRKLQLVEGQSLLDIGCGFGGLLLHAARRYGVTGVGITLSPAQRQKAQQQVAAAGLDHLITIRLMDYRDLPADEIYDRVVSVGMLEHVGRQFYSDFFHKVREVLRPEGLCLMQSIGQRIGSEAAIWITKYIFPGMYLPSLADISAPASAAGLYVGDVETLRLHYALTLERWLDNFDTHVDLVRQIYDDAFVRMWRLYLSCCISSFRNGELTLWQICLSHGRVNSLPLTRRGLYEAAADRREPTIA
jgi:cyclopropane-fatty-acyl-phospholipid synthase